MKVCLESASFHDGGERSLLRVEDFGMGSGASTTF